MDMETATGTDRERTVIEHFLAAAETEDLDAMMAFVHGDLARSALIG
jgi:hypothetical protein